MIFPYMDVLENWGSKYALTILAAKRAKQIKEGASPLIRTQSKNPLTIALEEIALGKITCEIAETDLVLPESIEPDVSALLSVPIDTSLVEEHEEEHEEKVASVGLLDEEELETEEDLEEDVGETFEEELAGAGIHEEDEDLNVGGIDDDNDGLPVGGIHDEDEHLTVGAFHDDDEVLDHPVLGTTFTEDEHDEDDELVEPSATGSALAEGGLDEELEDSGSIDLLRPKKSRRKSKSKSNKSNNDSEIDMGGMLEDIDPAEPEEYSQ